MADESRVTADDVARQAGVSRWTVNRAFRKDASISRQSYDRVMAAAEALDYTPDRLASTLRSDRSNIVALLVDDFTNPHKLLMMESLSRLLRRHGWDTLLVNLQGEEDAQAALLSANQLRVDAAVLIGVQFTDDVLRFAVGPRRVRKLVVFARSSDHPDTIAICCDDVSAMTELALYVHGKGYKRPLYVAGPKSASAHVQRQETFQSVWAAQTGHTPPAVKVQAYDTNLACTTLAEHLSGLPKSDLPDVIVCENDAIAFGAMDAVRHEIGASVPDEIAVTGFDDVPQASGRNYRLTTFRQPLAQMSQALIDLLEGADAASQTLTFSGELVVRDSA